MRASCAFLSEPREAPFFLYHNFALPHMPFFDVPARYRERFTRDDVLLRPNVVRDGREWYDEEALKIYWADWKHYRAHDPAFDALPPGFDLRALYAHYYGMVTAVDDGVGALLACLEATGQLEHTVIVFTADHGDNLGSHGLWNKISVNDEAIRVPFLVAWPGTLAPRVVNTHVASLVDVAPTLLALAGAAPPAHLQGRDLSPVLRGAADRVGDGAAYVENLRGELAVRTPEHLFAVMTRTSPDGPARDLVDDDALFFDLRDDPFELHNLAGTGAQADVAAALRQRVLAWDAATPWMPGSRGGLYAQGPQHDTPPRSGRSFG